MRQSHLFTKTLREAPADEAAKNAELLIRAGYIHKEMAGVYQLLPLGFRVAEKIKQIVREEMNAIGSQEMIATNLQRKELWDKTGRWSDETVDVWFKSTLKAGGEVGLAWSHEEPLADMMKSYITSYKDLPVSLYQFQNKLRNELRAKSGLLRGREFVMKDMYSFSAGEEDHNAFYEGSKDAYMKVFHRLGVGDDTFITFAAGGAFTEYSHEFQTICDAGEDTTFIQRDKNIAINAEVMNDEICESLGVTHDELEEVRTAEVGNIFNFGRQKGEELGLTFTDESGERRGVWMGSYGIGITRMMGVLVEKFSDENGIVWPASVAPFQVHLIGLNLDDPEIKDYVDGVYTTLTRRGVEVLYDDRGERPGVKFADSDLIGIPYRIVASKKTKESGTFEVVTRATGETTYRTAEEIAADFPGA